MLRIGQVLSVSCKFLCWWFQERYVFIASCGQGFPFYSLSSKNFAYTDFVKHFVKSKDTGVTETESGKN
jgi:hypothetical protein